MKVNSNIPALQANRALSKATQKADQSMLRLSTGYKINSVADNASGLAIANKLKDQLKGLQQASRNSMDGISLVQTAEGALNEVHDILQRIRELSVQSINDTYESFDRRMMQKEIEELTDEITAIAERTEFNRINLLNASGQYFHLQVGENQGMYQLAFFDKITASTLGLSSIDTMIAEGDKNSLFLCDYAVSKVSDMRARLGAYQNRLDVTVKNLDSASVNTATSISRIMDTDMASEMTEYTKNNVISQSSIAMIAQANTRPQQLLQLLQ